MVILQQYTQLEIS